MVTKSTINYDEWKKQVYEIYKLKYGPRKSQIFMDFVASRYDKLKRTHIPYKVLWRVFDSHMKVKNKNTHQVYGVFGRDGYGKSTIIKNILWVHDPTFNQNRIAKSMDDFILILYDVLKSKNNGRFKAILIDEPSKTTHSASMNWRMTEDVLGQIRQANLFIGVCATELRAIKSSVYSMITTLLAFRKHYVYDYYDEDFAEGITGNIIKEYKKTNTYEVFHNKYIKKKCVLRNISSFKQTPIDRQQKKYDSEKRKEFLNRVRKLTNQTSGKTEDKEEISVIDKLILKKSKDGLSTRVIGEHLNLAHGTIALRINKLEKKGYIIV